MAHTLNLDVPLRTSVFHLNERMILLVELSFSYLSSMFKYFLALSHVTLTSPPSQILLKFTHIYGNQ